MTVKSLGSDHQPHERTRLLGTNGKAAYSGAPEGAAYYRGPHGATEERLADERGCITADTGGLRRGLSARQVQMIAIGECAAIISQLVESCLTTAAAGTIGTGCSFSHLKA